MYDALIDVPEAELINTRHETGAVFMAMGYSRTAGTMPCVLMTSGPGITNAITGLAAAYADGIPLIAIGGEVPRKNFGRGALQEGSRYQLDVLSMVRSVTKLSLEVSNPRAAISVVRKAVATALSGRQGPVFLSLPLDVANERVAPVRTGSMVSTQFVLDDETMQGAAEQLQDAERGVIIAGSGARHPESVRHLASLASMLQMPVITTPKAKGVFPESSPLSLGVFGLGGHPSASEYLEGGIDTVLCVGCGLGETGTNSWSPVLQASRTFIQIDIDAAQIGKNYHVDYGLVGPSNLVLAGLTSRLKRRMAIPSVSGIRHYEAEKMDDASVPLKPPYVLRRLQELLPDDTIYSSDIGEHTIYSIHYLKINHPESFIVNTGLGSMGSGIGAAIGAKMARPHRTVAAICGDHGFQMFGMELATCVQNKVGVVFAIFNDSRMRMVENGQAKVFGRSGMMSSSEVDFALLAQAVGARGYKIRTPEDLDALPLGFDKGQVPVVLDIQIDPQSRFPVNGRVAQIRHFSAK
jgi:acetolactate synthase-1/2/3 large subunit